MKKEMTEKEKNDIIELTRVAIGNAKMCKDNFANKEMAKINLMSVKEDIICMSIVMPKKASLTGKIYTLLSQADDKAIFTSLDNEHKINQIINRLNQIRSLINGHKYHKLNEK